MKSVFRYINSLKYVADQHRYPRFRSPCRALRVFRVIASRRQAPVLLLLSTGWRRPVYALPFSIFIRRSICSITPWRSRWRTATSTYHWPVWILEGFGVRGPAEIDETVFWTAIRSAVLSSRSWCADRQRHRRRAFFASLFLGRIAAGAHADLGQRQADIGRHDP